MNNEKMDRRVQRTRQLLTGALMALITEKGYEAITVQNIIDRANLGRSTFYLHYQDKEDLMQSSIEGVVHSLIQGIESPSITDEEHEKTSPILSTLSIFRHAQEQHRLHKSMVGGQGVDVLTKEIQNYLSRHIQEKINLSLSEGQTPTVPPPVIANYLAGTVLTLLIWWLNNNMPYSPERMDEIFQDLTMPGIRAVLG